MTVTVLDTTGTQLYEQADHLRAAGPATRVEMPAGLIAWSVTRGEVVTKLLVDPRVSKDARKSWPGYRLFAVPWLAAWVDVISMFTTDGDDHQRLKNLVGKAFTARRIEAMGPAIEAVVTRLLDQMETHGPGARLDLRTEFSYPVPTSVICDLFGVPEEQRPQMLKVIDSVLDSSADDDRATEIRDAMYRAMQTLIAHKRDQPGEDMTSVLLETQQAGDDPLTGDELVSTLILMIGAGSETAVSLINHAVVELAQHPDQLAAVLADPSRWDDVVEETLRKHPPIMHLPLRYATDDIDLGGNLTIRKGDLILIGFGAHGRDPEANPDPGQFNIDREDRRHLAFGHGIHFCLGAALARLEARVALPALFHRFPRLQLATQPAELQPQSSFIGNDYRSVPVKLTPDAA
ncbi:cytochrome P450 [Streptomyces sp. CB01635]|uniref:cytochrome P450 family protein n=1 Tax=unclassified Streptomyces TaxID=2593676 RepID=UPI000C273BA3|nr:cytochrome P450 [Streptomyces sp. CB01635]PJN09615.1 cytochrome P450 [Streptomyces sp. CB01635]